MALAYVTEFADVSTFENLTCPKWSARVVEQAPITYTATTQSAAFGVNTRYIVFTADGIFSWTIGSNPTATTSKMRFPAGTIFTIAVQPGDKIAFITNT